MLSCNLLFYVEIEMKNIQTGAKSKHKEQLSLRAGLHSFPHFLTKRTEFLEMIAEIFVCLKIIVVVVTTLSTFLVTQNKKICIKGNLKA